MPVDPAQDPFGAAMLAAAALFGLSVLMVLIQRVRGASTSAGGWIMGFSLVGFLGAAVAGAAERVTAGPSSATPDQGPAAPAVLEPDPTEPEPNTDGATDTDAAAADTDTPTAETDGPETGGEEDTDGAPVDDAPEPEPAAPDPGVHPDIARLNVAAAGPFIDVIDAYRELKTEGKVPREVKARYDELRAERTEQIREWMRASNQVSGGTCRDPAKIARAFENLRGVDRREPLFKVVSAVVEKLERCRRRYATWLEEDKHRKREAQRADFARKLAEELSEPGRKVAASTSGKKGTLLRLVGSVLTEERIQAEVDKGRLEEIRALGFSRVTFSDGSKASQRNLKPAPEVNLAAADLEAQGLAEPLAL